MAQVPVPVKKIEQGLLPVGETGNRFRIVEADELAGFKIGEQLHGRADSLAEVEVKTRKAQFLRLMAACLQQMALAEAGLSPEKNERFAAAGDALLQMIDDGQIRAREKILERVVRPEHELQRQLFCHGQRAFPLQRSASAEPKNSIRLNRISAAASQRVPASA
jgi:hypothetical protein